MLFLFLSYKLCNTFVKEGHIWPLEALHSLESRYWKEDYFIRIECQTWHSLSKSETGVKKKNMPKKISNSTLTIRIIESFLFIRQRHLVFSLVFIFF